MKKVRFIYNKKLIDKILKEAYSREYGVRSVKRYIEEKIGTLIAKNIIFNVIKSGCSYLVDLIEETNEIKLSFLVEQLK